MIGAAVGGVLFAAGFTALATFSGGDRPPVTRYELEVRLLTGAWMGAVFGMAIGAGLGAVRRPDPAG